MRRALIALALVGGVAVSGISDAQTIAQRAARKPLALTHVPGTTPGALFEETADTVMHWSASDWNMTRFPEDLTQVYNTYQASAAALVITNITAVTPNGTLGPVSRITFPAVTSGGAASIWRRTHQVPIGAVMTYSVYLKAAPGSGITRLPIELMSGDGGYVGTMCSVNESTWTRCSATKTQVTATNMNVNIGGFGAISCVGGAGGICDMPIGGDVYAWGIQLVRDVGPHPYKSPPVANLLSSPSDFGNAVWVKYGLAGAATPVVTPNAALAPDGTMTADRLDIGAINDATQLSGVGPSLTSANGVAYTGKVWLKAVSTPGTTYVGLGSGVPSGGEGTACAVVPTEWRQCSVTHTAVGGNYYILIGADGRGRTGTQPTSQPAISVYAWNATLTRADINGDTFAAVGSPTFATSSPAFPGGFGTGRRGAGPFSDSNYFSYATASDPLDSTGDRYGCLAFTPAVGAFATTPVLMANGGASVAGHYLQVGSATGYISYITNTATPFSVNTANLAVPQALNAVCWWRTGTSINIKLNGGVTATNASAGTELSGAAYPLYLGRYTTGGFAFNGTIHEMVQGLGACPSTSCEAWATEQMTRAFTNGDPSQPLFTDAPTDKMHLIGAAFNGTTWNAPAWAQTTNGTIGYSDAFVPPAVQGVLNRPGYNGFTDANYLALGSGLDVLDTAGDRWGCMAFTPPNPITANYDLYSNGTSAVAGHYVELASTGIMRYRSATPTSAGANTTNAAVPGSPNVTCWWRTGSTIGIQLNTDAPATNAAAGTEVAGTAYTARLGRYDSAGGAFTGGAIHEFIAGVGPCPDTSCTAWAAKQVQRAMGILDAHGASLAVTRTTTETVEIPAATGQTLWTVPAGVPATGPNGIGVFHPATNVALQSEDSTIAPWASTNAVLLANPATGPDGLTSMDRATVSVARGGAWQNPTVSATAGNGPYTSTMWIKEESGTPYVGGYCGVGAATSCSCAIAAGNGVVAATMSASTCFCDLTGSTVPTRVASTYTCATATTSAGVSFGVVGTGSSLGFGAQVETGAYATPYKKTTSTATTGNSTLITTPNKVTAQDTTWCASGVWTPYMRPWATTDGVVRTLWSAGTYNAANSGRVEIIEGNLIFSVLDGQGALTESRYALGTLAGSRAVRACVAEGRQALYVDGTLVEAAKLPTPGDWQNPPPAAWTTPPATFTIGARGDNTAHFDGYARDFKVEDSPLAKPDLAAIDAKIVIDAAATSSGALLDEDAYTTFHWVADEWNMVRFPNDWTVLPWVGGGVTAEANATLAPDGTMTGNRIYKSSAVASQARYQQIQPAAFPAGVYTVSVFVKATATSAAAGLSLFCAGAGTSSISARILSGPGSLGVSTVAYVSGLSLTQWTRVSFTGTAPGGAACYFMVYPDGEASATLNAANYVWGAQLVRGDRALPYKSPPVANQLSAPSDFSATAWGTITTGTGTAPAVVTNQAIAPDGTLTADRITLNRGAGDTAGDQSRIFQQSVSVVNGATYNFGVWLKHAGTPCSVALEGGSGNYYVVNLTSEWQRFIAPPQVAGSTAAINFAYISDRGTYGTTRGCAFYAWNAQLTRPDVNGDAAVMVGTVPMSGVSPLFKNGFGTGRREVGPFTDANYFQPFGSLLSDPLDSSGDRWGIIAFTPTSAVQSGALVGNGLANTAGHVVAVNGGAGTVSFRTYAPGSDLAVTTSNTVVLGARNIACWWTTGTVLNLKLNGWATMSGNTGRLETSGTGYGAKIGRYEGAGAAFAGTIPEVVQGLGVPAGYATPEAWCVDQMSKAFVQGDPSKPLFTPPSNTISYLRGADYAGGAYWGAANGGATKVGTVGYSDAFVPPVDGQLQRTPFGPYSAANNFTGPTALGEWTGDWSATLIFTPTGNAAAQTMIAKTSGSNKGWSVYSLAGTGGSVLYVQDTQGVKTATTSGYPVVGAVNVLTVGRVGSTIYSRLNGNALSSLAVLGAMTPASSEPFRIGRYGDAGGEATTTHIHEVLLSNAPYSDATHLARWNKVMGHLTASGATVTNTRTTTTTLPIPRGIGSTGPTLYTVPASATAVGPDGYGAWKSATNYALQSQTSCVGTAAQAPWTLNGAPTCAADTDAAPDGTTTMDAWANGVSTENVFQTTTTASSTTFTASAWMKKSATGSSTIHVSGLTSATTCTCGTSDGSACTATANTPGAGLCQGIFTAVGTTPIRGWVSATGTATTTPGIYLTPGAYGVSAGATRFWGTQVEPGLYPTPYIPTTTAAVQRNADTITVALPPDLAYANLVARSEDLGTTWGGGGGTVTADQGPVGFTDLDKLTVLGVNNVQFQTYTTGSAIAGPFTSSAWMAADVGTDVQTLHGYCIGQNVTGVSCARSDGGTCTVGSNATNAWAYGTSTTTPARWTLTWSCAAGVTQFGMGFHDGRYSNDVGNGSLFGRAQLVFGVQPLTYLPTTSAVAYSDQKWCVDGYWTPGSGRAWATTTSLAGLFMVGSAGVVNSAYLNEQGGNLYFDVHDGASGQKYVSVNVAAWTAGATYRLTACNNNGTLAIWRDGVVVSGAQVGAGLGKQTGTASTITIGARDSGTAFDGYARGFRVVKGVTTPQEIDATP